MSRFSSRRLAARTLSALLVLGVAAAAPARLAPVPCDADNGGLSLPPGFCATIFADKLQAPRHMAVAPNGDVIVNGNPPRTAAQAGGGAIGGLLLLLRDTNGDGKADTTIRLAAGGGTGVWLANGYLYATSGRAIVRYRYDTGVTTLAAPDTIVSQLATGGHVAYNFVVIDTTLYMNVGSATNVCQPRNEPQVRGIDPCVELETRAGIWMFSANRTGQTPADGVRFATGVRNVVSLTVNPRDSTLWATMHGRDNLTQNWGFPPEYGAENPGEETIQILRGDDFGWPYCYYSNEEKKLVTAPEYGGDGKASDRCKGKKAPVFSFPGHWAPNDMLFYSGRQFPPEWRNGSFIAFHGSSNRAPLPAQGFRVSFLGEKDGRAQPQVTFADGFSKDGLGSDYDKLIHRPAGLAEGADGSLYVADDFGGRIWKISYKGVR